jgi:small subunit ribosomal protein S5
MPNRRRRGRDHRRTERSEGADLTRLSVAERIATMNWKPITKLGKLVASGDIKSMNQVLTTRMPIREVEIVDAFLPGLADEVLDVKMVQRMTDSGRRTKFVITVCVGNRDGYVALGRARGKEVGPAIRKAIRNAKLNIIEIRRGCGSWECGCRKPHTIPFAVTGRAGSVRVTLKPAPRGVGLAVAGVVRHVLNLAGVSDAWSFTAGHTKTTINYAYAAFNALKTTGTVPIHPTKEMTLAIISGSAPKVDETAVEAKPKKEEEGAATDKKTKEGAS